MKTKWQLAFVLALPISAFAEPSLEETWPLCKGWSYKIEPYLAYRSDELTYDDARQSLERLNADRGPKFGDGIMTEQDSFLRLQGYMLRYKAEQVPVAERENSQAVAAFCSWVASKHAPE